MLLQAGDDAAGEAEAHFLIMSRAERTESAR
jgi:hypothetical protein